MCHVQEARYVDVCNTITSDGSWETLKTEAASSTVCAAGSARGTSQPLSRVCQRYCADDNTLDSQLSDHVASLEENIPPPEAKKETWIIQHTVCAHDRNRKSR